MKEYYCDKCFRLINDQSCHCSWCPNKPQELEDMFGGAFKDIFKENKNENEKDTADRFGD